MKFKILQQKNSDTQILETTTPSGMTIEVKNEFHFTGFTNSIHPYHRNRYNFLVQALASKGIHLNVLEVPTVNDMTDDVNDEFTYDKLKLPATELKVSDDGNTYILFQDVEMGRGWAMLMKNKEVITQEHRDIVWDELEQGDWIRSFGVDYEYSTVAGPIEEE